MRGTFTVRPTGVGLIPHGDKYSIKDLGDTMQGYIELAKRELGVSLNADLPYTRFVQLHELSHIKWSRATATAIARKAGVSTENVLAAEDSRVNTRLLETVLDAHEGFRLPSRREGEPPVLRTDLSGYVASYGAPPICGRTIRKELEAKGLSDTLDALDEVYDKLRAGSDRSISGFTMPMARALKAARNVESPESIKAAGKPKPGDEELEECEDSESEFVSDNGMWAEKPTADPRGQQGKAGSKNETWIIPSVETVPLAHTLQRPGTHDYVSSDAGTLLRDVTRIATDGQVFGRSLRRPGTVKRGTILIDVSGSMRLTNDDITQLINAVPMATVALYSSIPSRSAAICIVAKDGKAGSVRDGRHGSGNGCDGPALLWLSRMPQPRVWVCDGFVTDFYDHPSDLLSAECEALCAAGRILHVDPKTKESSDTVADFVLSELRKRRLVK